MNAKKIKKLNEVKVDSNLTLVHAEQSAQTILWGQIKKIFSSQDLTFQEWQRLEMKRTRSSCNSIPWRNL
jgi:hypothetical protein